MGEANITGGWVATFQHSAHAMSRDGGTADGREAARQLVVGTFLSVLTKLLPQKACWHQVSLVGGAVTATF